VAVREKDLEEAQLNLNHEWMEERTAEELSEESNEESAEGIELEEPAPYTPDELLILEMDEVEC
ncbi:hypothetical protein A2U01_0038301, partial [Trifolium medium]|nr:hypothetical protein [Trifolium medium]